MNKATEEFPSESQTKEGSAKRKNSTTRQAEQTRHLRRVSAGANAALPSLSPALSWATCDEQKSGCLACPGSSSVWARCGGVGFPRVRRETDAGERQEAGSETTFSDEMSHFPWAFSIRTSAANGSTRPFGVLEFVTLSWP
jgi:hypothetical protein